MKKCSTCKRVLPVTMFSKHSRTKDGLRCQCKDCVREYNKKTKVDKERSSFSEQLASVEGLFKTCTKCGRVLPLSSFYASKNNRSGLQSWCKDCTNRKEPQSESQEPDKTIIEPMEKQTPKDEERKIIAQEILLALLQGRKNDKNLDSYIDSAFRMADEFMMMI